MTDQRAVIKRAHRNQLCPATGEIQHLQCAGVIDQALDIVGNQLLGADQDIDRQGFLCKQSCMSQVLQGAHPGNLGGGMKQRVGDLTRDHIGLVAAGNRQHHVRIIGTRLGERLRIGCMAGNGTYVESILQILKDGRVFIDHGNIVGFIGQVGRNGSANLAGTQNDDFHWLDPDAALSSAMEIPNRRCHSAPFL